MTISRYTHAPYGSLTPLGLGCFQGWSSKLARSWTLRLVDRIEKDENVHALVGIGSAVRTSAAADLDFVLIYESSKPSSSDHPIDVDVRSFRRSDVARLLSEGHELLGWAVLYGCPIIDKGRYWEELCRLRRDSVPLPSAEAARERARRAEEHLTYLRSAGDRDAAQEQEITMLTHLARAALIEASVFPASRPELPDQLRQIGKQGLARELERSLEERIAAHAG